MPRIRTLKMEMPDKRKRQRIKRMFMDMVRADIQGDCLDGEKRCSGQEMGPDNALWRPLTEKEERK